jgi:hypothetical protein
MEKMADMIYHTKFLFCIITLALCVFAQQPGKAVLAKPLVKDTATNIQLESRSSDSLITSIDSAGLPQDTSRAQPSDSLKTAQRPVKPDSASRKDSTELEDTLYTFWLRPFWGLGAGFSLGSFPVFDVWQRGLPDSLGTFGIPAITVIKGIFPNGDTLDTLHLLYDEKVPPNAYTIYFPVTFSRYFGTSEKQYTAVDLSLFLLYKKLQAEIRDDSSTNRVSLKQSFGFYTCALWLRYQRSIPERYFTIGELRQSSISFGFDFHPLVYVRKKNTVTVEDGSNPLFVDFKNRAAASLTESSEFGLGLSWKAGISAIKKYSSNTGLEVRLLYLGQWFIFPGTNETAINQNAPSNKENYSFICHRLAVQMALLRGVKKEKPSDN